MTTKTKIFTVTAFIVGALFLAEMALRIASGNIDFSILFELSIAVSCLVYGVKQIKLGRSASNIDMD
jgi:hypothetical protein